MPVKTDAIGKQWPAATYEVGAEKIREFADAIGAANPFHRDHEAAKSAGYRDLVAPPMFCVVYSARAMGPAILDPEIGINLATMLHGSQEFEWDEPVCDGDVIETTASVHRDLREGRQGLLRLRVGLDQSGRQEVGEGHLDQHRQGGVMAELKNLKEGDAIPELKVTPDKYLPHRYAGASGDFNPIHIDPEFAKAVGLPGNILHGLWMMAQVARGNAQLAGRRSARSEAPLGPVPGHGLPRAGARGERHGQGGRGRSRR